MSAVLRRNLILICILLFLIGLTPRPVLAQITSLNFGTIPVGQHTDQVLTKTLFLSGIYTSATISTPYITGPNAADFQITKDGFTGGPYQNGVMLSVTIRFTPSTSGPEQATLDGSGMVQPGNVPLDFVPVTLNGAGSGAVPPVIVSSAKLGTPTYDNQFYYTVPVYFKGQGNGEVTGQLLIDNVPFATADFGTVFAPGIWQEGTVSVPRSQLLGSPLQGAHTIQFAFSGNQAITGVASVSDIGFDPAVNGWQFSNGAYDIFQKETSGFCLGLSLVDESYYQNYKTTSYIPASYRTPTQLPNSVRNQINIVQVSGNKRQAVSGGVNSLFAGGDIFQRLQSYTSSGTLAGASNQVSSESKMLEAPLATGNPSVMLLFNFPFDNKLLASSASSSHAVVVFVAFDIDNGFIEASPDATGTIRSFLVYDSNDPGYTNSVEVDNVGGLSTMNYNGYDYLAAY